MSDIYHNWERLVDAVLLNQHFRDLALCPSFDSSYITSPSSSFNHATFSDSPFPSFHHSDAASTTPSLLRANSSGDWELDLFGAELDSPRSMFMPQVDSGAAERDGVVDLDEIFHLIRLFPNTDVPFHEDSLLSILRSINNLIELCGSAIRQHPLLLSSIQDGFFRKLIAFGLSKSPLILTTVCDVVLNLYRHLRTELKLQLEAFFSCVILRLAQSKSGASYQQQEVVMEALAHFCREKDFMVEMYANLDCDITCGNVFEDLANLLSKSVFQENSSLSSLNILALDGLIAVIQGMVERIGNGSIRLETNPVHLEEYTPFWMEKCENYSNPDHWVPYVRKRKYIKRRLKIGADHFYRDPKKGLEFLQGIHLLPEMLDMESVACLFRYTAGLDKTLIADFLRNPHASCEAVLREFLGAFDFQDMNLDTALSIFLDSFHLPEESQGRLRILEAFSERYYQQSPQILANKDAVLLLSNSLIMLSKNQHDIRVKKKMSEEVFIRNNRRINAGNKLPRKLLSDLYYSIRKNEINITSKQGAGFAEMTPSRWIDLVKKSKNTSPYIVVDSGEYLDRDLLAICSAPTIAAISVVFDHAENEDVYQMCIDGFLAVAVMSASYHLEDVLDDVIVCLCKFTTLFSSSSAGDPVRSLSDEAKARLATLSVFAIADMFGDCIHTGWRSILDCIIMLHKLGMLPLVASNTKNDSEISADRSSVLFQTEHLASQPLEQQLAAHQHIDSIFTESKIQNADSLLQLARAIIQASERDEDSAVFCLDLLFSFAFNNRGSIELFWQPICEHIANIIGSTTVPCALVEKAVSGLLHTCQRLLVYKENVDDELILRSLELVLKLDALMADYYWNQIAEEVNRLVKASATRIQSPRSWRIIVVIFSIAARHPWAAESGFEGLSFIMVNGDYLSPANFIPCVDAARQFAHARVGNTDRSVLAVDLMAGSVFWLIRCAKDARKAMSEAEAVKLYQDIREMWLGLVQGLRKVCLDQREEVRNHALQSLLVCLTVVVELYFPLGFWLQCFEMVVFTMLDDLAEIAEEGSSTRREYENIEGTLVLALNVLAKVFLHLLTQLSQVSSFGRLWQNVMGHMEKYMKLKVKRRGKLQELVPELVKNMLLAMKTEGVLVPTSGDRVWEQTWLHVDKMFPSLKAQVFPISDLDHAAAGG